MQRKPIAIFLCLLLSLSALSGCTNSARLNDELQSAATAPPAAVQDMPGGPTGQPGEKGRPEGLGSGSSEGGIALTGALEADGSSSAYDGSTDGEKLSSSTPDENVVLVKNAGELKLMNVTLNKTGDENNDDETDFYAVNAIAAAKSGAKLYISDTGMYSDARGANALFASGSTTDASGAEAASTIYVNNVDITTSKNNSRGLDATYGGIIVAADMDISTSGEHCAGVATDRGGGSISIDSSAIETNGGGSPILYSTGIIEVSNSNGTANGSQLAGVEGRGTVRITNSVLCSTSNAQDDVNNGVILYQSTSGDALEGKALFEASDSTLSTTISGPNGSQVDSAMFYVTNTDAQIILKNTRLDYDSSANKLLTARANDHNNWGAPGSNGGSVKLTVIAQPLNGDISCDGASSVTMYLTEGSIYTGAILFSTEYAGDGGASVFMGTDTKWIVTGDSTLKALSLPSGAVIEDESGRTVTIKGIDGTVYVQGDGAATITAGSYGTTDDSTHAGILSEATLDRAAFNTYFGIAA